MFDRCTTGPRLRPVYIAARLLGLLILTVFVVGGCQSKNKRQAVSGTVTFKGEPLDTGSITFLTIDPPGPAGGALIENGKFQVSADMGLVPGQYRVLISSPKGEGERTPEQVAAGASTPGKERIPVEFNKDSKIMIEVKADSPNQFSWTID